MSNTTLISLRLPDSLLLAIDATAGATKRSRSWVIVNALENLWAKQESHSSEPLQIKQKPVNPRVRAISEPSTVKACPVCFALNGMHQRGCKNG